MITGELVAVEAPDTARFVGGGGLLIAYENADRARFTGRFITYGELAAVETPDSANFFAANTGYLFAREAPDRWLQTAMTSGTLHAIEAQDRARFTVYLQAGKIGDEPMIEIIDVMLPENVERGLKGGPQFNTSIFTGANGAEYRSINWPRQFGKWSLSLGYRNDDDPDYQAVLNLFYACRGRGYGFRMLDYADYKITDAPLAATAGAAMQIQKVYAAGTATFARKITRPKPGTVVIKDVFGQVISGATVDYTTGLVTGASAGATCSCQFWCIVRFDIDSLEIDVERDGLCNVPNIEIIEIAS